MSRNRAKALEREVRVQFTLALLSVLKASVDRGLKLTSRSADGSTGLNKLKASVKAYYVSRCNPSGKRGDLAKSLCAGVSNLMAEISSPGHIFSKNATTIAADVSWYLLLSQCAKPVPPGMTKNGWADAVVAAKVTYSYDLIESRRANYARLIPEHWILSPDRLNVRAYDDVFAWAKQQPWFDDFMRDIWESEDG
jgi:hypothetical protein